MDVFDVLDEIRLRPSMFLGGADDRRDEQMRNLELVMSGYALALRVHRIDEKVADFQRDFSKYLYERYGWSMSCGPMAGILIATSNGDDAWRQLWLLVDEFRQSVSG